MILKTLRFLFGYVEIEINGSCRERFLNLCAVSGISFWRLCGSGDTIRVSVPKSKIEIVQSISEKSGCAFKVIGKRGLPFIFFRIKHRTVLFGGAAAFLILLFVMSGIVWSIEVSGNEKVNDDKIIAALQRNGFKIGTVSAACNLDSICEKMKIDVPELMWITVNIKGSKASVLVRERKQKPEMVDIKTPSDIIAAKDGLIIGTEVSLGSMLIKAGDTVKEGDLLVSGIIQSEKTGRHFVPSRGRVMAKTWQTIKSSAPMTVTENKYTGSKKVRYCITVFGRSLKLYFSSSIYYENYDKIVNINELRLGPEIYLPVCLIKETYNECIPQLRELTYEQQLELCRARRNELFASENTACEVLSCGETVGEENGRMTLLSEYCCVEDIAKQVPVDYNDERINDGGENNKH